MRYLSLHLPFLPTDRVLRAMRASRSPKPADTPLATLTKVKGAQRLAAVDARASQLGLRPGMALADARAMHPSLMVADADPHAEAQTLSHIIDWCRRFTPLVAGDERDGIMLDIAGVAHLFGGEAALCADIEAKLARQNFAGRTGIGPNPEAAWAMARFSREQILADTVQTGELKKVFGDFPLAALGLDAEIIARLAQAGLRRIGDVALRPRAPIAARFGTPLLARLDALLGQAKSAISPRFESPPYMVERRFAEGLAQQAAIHATIATLAKDLCALLERHGEGARRLALSLFRVDGVVRHVDAGTSRPQQDPQAMARLFAERLAAQDEGGLDTGYGFDVIRLAATAVEPSSTVQTAAIMTDDAHGAQLDVASERDLADLIDRLSARLGLRRVTRLMPNGTHIPEFAICAVPAAHAARHKPLNVPPPASERPLRLLDPPERIETIAMVPDGAPLKFRWRRVLHEVAAIEGPERIAPEWWKAAAPGLARDYFRAEDESGKRFWLYREGVFGSGAARPGWFMHGLFA